MTRDAALQAATDQAAARLDAAREAATAEQLAQDDAYNWGRGSGSLAAVAAWAALASLTAEALALVSPWADRAGPPVRLAHWSRMVADLQDAADLAAYAEADAADLAPVAQTAPHGLLAAEALAEASASLVEALSLTQED